VSAANIPSPTLALFRTGCRDPRRPYELVSERPGRPVIITANRAAEDWYSLFPNPVVAESILDRVVSGAHHINMSGRSYRPNHRPRPGRHPHTTAKR
jgi:IstB-like ATP binding protein